jgi:hypothetical protein
MEFLGSAMSSCIALRRIKESHSNSNIALLYRSTTPNIFNPKLAYQNSLPRLANHNFLPSSDKKYVFNFSEPFKKVAFLLDQLAQGKT